MHRYRVLLAISLLAGIYGAAPCGDLKSVTLEQGGLKNSPNLFPFSACFVHAKNSKQTPPVELYSDLDASISGLQSAFPTALVSKDNGVLWYFEDSSLQEPFACVLPESSPDLIAGLYSSVSSRISEANSGQKKYFFEVGTIGPIGGVHLNRDLWTYENPSESIASYVQNLLEENPKLSVSVTVTPSDRITPPLENTLSLYPEDFFSGGYQFHVLLQLAFLGWTPSDSKSDARQRRFSSLVTFDSNEENDEIELLSLASLDARLARRALQVHPRASRLIQKLRAMDLNYKQKIWLASTEREMFWGRIEDVDNLAQVFLDKKEALTPEERSEIIYHLAYCQSSRLQEVLAETTSDDVQGGLAFKMLQAAAYLRAADSNDYTTASRIRTEGTSMNPLNYLKRNSE